MRPISRIISAIPLLVCAALVAGIGYLLAPTPQPSQTITITDTIPGDSVPIYYIVDRPVPYEVLVPDTIPSEIDTFLIIKDYLSRVAYNDTLKDDTSALVVVIDTLQGNRIKDRGFVFQNRRPTTTNTTIINPMLKCEDKQAIVGGLGTAFTPKFDISLKAGYRAKNGYEYLLSRSVNGNTEVMVVIPIVKF